jgi:hypothetical protein
VTLGHKTLQIETNALEFPVGELHEQVNALGHMKIVVSRMSMQKLQDLQGGLVKEIKNRGEEDNKELERIRDKRAQLQDKYDTTLQQKREFEGRIEEALKNKDKVE